VTPSLPWIEGLPPCYPAFSQVVALGCAVEDQPQRAARRGPACLVRTAKVQEPGFAGSKRPKIPGHPLLDPPLGEPDPGLVIVDLEGLDGGGLVLRRQIVKRTDS
jgi:hypothetical protein